uniref:Reverse transcriptase domain-containing protein n=1 Tax=Steinernema glaseri TaxID=37863 RepID=A0A1I7XXY1_9BILA
MDTGSDITIITHDTWKKLGAPRLEQDAPVAVGVTGHPLPLHGYFEAVFQEEKDGAKLQGRCYVNNGQHAVNLLGHGWLNTMNYTLVKKLDSRRVTQMDWSTRIAEEFPDLVKKDLGRFNLSEARLELKPSAVPIFRRPRPVPFHASTIIDDELDRLQKLGVISPIAYSHWAAPIVVVGKKNGKTRVCADFKTGLNEALEDNRHPIPLPAAIFAMLSGGAVFSQLDLSDAYLQIPLDEESKKLAVINTHRGLYQYNRLAFGIKSAPGIFQGIMDAVLSGVPGAAAYLDDIIVTGRTDEEHEKNLLMVLRRLHEAGFRIRM